VHASAPTATFAPYLRSFDQVQKFEPVQALISCQTWVAKEQCTNRCVQVSGAARQSSQVALLGQPPRCKLSAVRQRRCTASHIKNLHRGVAFDFQIALAHGKRMLAAKNSPYALLVENSPSTVCFRVGSRRQGPKVVSIAPSRPSTCHCGCYRPSDWRAGLARRRCLTCAQRRPTADDLMFII
jgi:hypothetical protein